ncbi:uncharacterized protein TRIVIDRAFT_47013 [Trichoderma virens Gv29-8]|uniref:DUF7719 domain-containing protein n=1 Tax=Hypocrea virens (strain Gv29-8 / FGSC 10586) TaxID=413071 RepID=G9N098_HYPVG|nr:uncharacterized protein TRIVIDRAFT_47013 [Trichoderma virens Gv29-8]EHK19780.1 hypothetical protein TRIVIDRAFT_47013 [Trichoderma virens Gv29-8]UKZ53170.1 hypothetical protein TrVGV298_006962 [Trichoderma virens]
MAKNRKDPKSIKLRQPDRSAPTEKTLLQIASERSLFEQAARREKQLAGKDEDEDDKDESAKLSPGAERFLEAMLYTTTLAMLHLTFDVLVMKQYAAEIKWKRIITNAGRMWMVFFFLFYSLHPAQPNQVLIPGLPRRFQRTLRQMLFFAMSCVSGCALVYITNSKGYLYNMKRAPPLGCLWLWAVVELDLLWAVPSLLVTAAYVWVNGYSIK